MAFSPGCTKNAVVAAAKAESGMRRLEFLNVAIACGQIPVHAVQGFRLMSGDLSLEGRTVLRVTNGWIRVPVCFFHSQPKLATHLIMRNALPPKKRIAGTIQRGDGFRRETFFIDRCQSQRLGKWIDEHLEQVAHSRQLSRGSTSRSECACWRSWPISTSISSPREPMRSLKCRPSTRRCQK